jgi:antitoxin CcdA
MALHYEINTPRAQQERLEELVRQKERDAWLERNRAAIEAYNRRVECEGAFSDSVRTF